ncbi:YqaA family protein [Odoribacter sp. Z80]|uniref:YqaA family protein n=1 Tax=Odoribacter sp. Z80 TaxID=2304575 RepID=UPI00137B3A9F|nr:YqaA family protein [Odoribacter sp. Z80]NCE73254.1 DedA family protein [Odoribacter sp. Z80]
MNSFIELGYWGLFLGSFLASTLIPMSADVLLIGTLALGGNPWICLLIATMGNWLGGLTSYWLGRIGKWEWIERWLKVKEEKLLQQKKNIDRYGIWLALFTWLPIAGDLFAIALGFYKVNPWLSAIYMLIGRLGRFLVWIFLYLHFAERFFPHIS